jgi:hypothetical protein
VKLNVQGYNQVILFLREINIGIWPSRLGESNSETVKYGHETYGLRP